MRAHSSSRDIVDRKKWDLMKDSWRAHVKRAGNRTRPCADSMDELTRWVNEATSLLPRKVTKTGPSTRRPAHSSKIQRACDRQIRLLEREAMIAKDLVTDMFIVTHSMRQISTLAHIEAVAPIKLISSSPSASDLNDWRMALQQGIRERRQVLREAHRLQRTELLQKLRDRCRERMDRPGEREIQELMGKRVKQDAPDYRASRNPAKKHPDKLSGLLSRQSQGLWQSLPHAPEVVSDDRTPVEFWNSVLVFVLTAQSW